MKEALFLAVWLRRQEAEVYRDRLMAQGFSDLVGAMGGKSNVEDAFQKLIAALMPYAAKEEGSKDRDLVATMKKHTEKPGVLTFKPVSTEVFNNRVKKLQVPDEFAQKMREKRERGMK